MNCLNGFSVYDILLHGHNKMKKEKPKQMNPEFRKAKPGLKGGKSEDFWSSTCNHITFYCELEEDERCIQQGEFCATVHFGSDSEEKLCFPEEIEIDKDKKAVEIFKMMEILIRTRKEICFYLMEFLIEIFSFLDWV